VTITAAQGEATGEEATQDVFVERLLPLVPTAHRLAYGMLHDVHEAEDAVQEAIFKAWRAFGRLRTDSNVGAWFLKIVANQCRQQRRSRWWTVLRQAEPPDAAAADPGMSMEDADELRRALARLPHDQRLAVVLRYYLDLPFEEVGRVLGVSTQAAKSRVHRVLGRLRLELEEVLDDA
jgi:RNA polymerase sigma-70 factor (sigma-E family)